MGFGIIYSPLYIYVKEEAKKKIKFLLAMLKEKWGEYGRPI